MSEFQREERYIVVKRSDFHTEHDEHALRQWLDKFHVPTRECVVVESDWPIYEIVWHLVERLATGQRLPYMTDEDPEVVEMERDHLVMAVEQEGLKIGSHGSGLCITDESLSRLKAGAVTQFANEVWDEMLRHQKTINVLPLTMAKDWIARQAEGGE